GCLAVVQLVVPLREVVGVELTQLVAERLDRRVIVSDGVRVASEEARQVSHRLDDHAVFGEGDGLVANPREVLLDLLGLQSALLFEQRYRAGADVVGGVLTQLGDATNRRSVADNPRDEQRRDSTSEEAES